ncbi:MAG: zinc ribbon domain-containing protein [Thermoplasmata archaeon]|nr:zinc ribbon domain-containing protein [Thermoplasmata archaeon]HDD60020.1 hypothetical protein [Euryarchaeota archaeon]RLF55263.1 MAG: hypothetical protein DRN28_03780 [Thermoplasmata archaeon]RLF70445.1 MAG: hypothetical protein DRN40_04555 [Thermoplasmata archaeon]RLF70969.1 MAG: hypothetical protein DRN35_03300 [Thermoplasmata archaeon]
MASKLQWIKRLRFAGDGALFAILLLFIYIFLRAYFSDYTAEIDINQYGEARVELIILLGVILPLAALTLAYSYLDLVTTWKARQWVVSTDYSLLEGWRRKLKGGPVELKCTSCGRTFPFDPLSAPSRYVKLVCPSCGKSGVVDVLSLKGREGESDIKVRVIKDIWDRGE